MIRPQPIGVFPYPTGLLLLPAVDADQPALTALLRGETPESWPEAWHFFEASCRNDRDLALSLLASQDSQLAHYNRYVLSGEPAERAQAEAGSDPVLSALTRMAAFVLGDEYREPDWSLLDRELAGHARLVSASHALETGDLTASATELDAGIAAARVVSPLLAAQLLAQRAGLEEAGEQAEALWKDAIALAGDTPLPGLQAELLCGYALVVHQIAESRRHRLVEATQLYQQALRAGIDRESHPLLWARIQSNLGIAYVAMPMSEAGDKLRLAVAVQAFREALSVYDRETNADEWASTMLNMANAMQYMPSGHRQENLMQAVEAYEELLTVRPRAMDPVGYARILANQGNALAHLGIFGHAVEKLTEAHKLLHWHGEADAAQRLLEQLELINGQLSTAGVPS
ncbi:MAG TPA: hypothetical protein DGD08_01500 [Gemmatimonas aurantiaca]|uniref:Tetratricopeptide repeat protein n=2 Tax=Gemmatimonas aurantiaca TaxID=173480 RepID=C1A5E1_GEMAT|nr:hypothetical protein [Gemmatimonas aurantiaca]BAH37451.1 hypothetical protein GAU_0409 [Gemmatimonas aurantiaca T-27]HCT55867.1 hypothetical protein [Gemmatimonas aurantiaca]